jgi:hypothetical protein
MKPYRGTGHVNADLLSYVSQMFLLPSSGIHRMNDVSARTLKMEAETVSETSDINSTLKRLMEREYLIVQSQCESSILGVLISLWLFLFLIFLFEAQPKIFFLDGLKKLEQRSHKFVELRKEYVE